MAIRNTGLGGTDWIDGDGLISLDNNDTFDEVVDRLDNIEDGTTEIPTYPKFSGQTQSGILIQNTTSELSSAQVIVGANTVTNAILVIATFDFDNSSTPRNVTARLRVGNSGTPTSNTQELIQIDNPATSTGNQSFPTFIKYITGHTWSSIVNVDATIQPSASSTFGGTCTSLVVLNF